MAVDATGNLALVNQTTNPSKSETSRLKLADDFDSFLNLLTTQLKNQDPTEPLDTNQFTQQLVQFSEVEQTVQMNDYLEKMLAVMNNQVGSGVNYLGQTIEAEGNAGFLNNGVANFTYNLPAAASSVSVVISDIDGTPVFGGNGSTATGKNLVQWDGSNSYTGAQMPEGDYYINIVAKDAAGDVMEDTTTSTTGTVTSAEMIDGVLNLVIGNIKVPVDKVTGVRQPTQVATAP